MESNTTKWIKKSGKIAKKSKGKHMNEQCGIIEDVEKKNPRLMHEKLKETTNKRRICSAVSFVESKDGTIIMEKEKSLERLEEYIKALFEDNRESVMNINREKENLPFTNDEIEIVIKSIPRNKSGGPDDVAIELIQSMDDLGVAWITIIANKMYEEGHFPLDMRRSTFIDLLKKPGTAKCELHRTRCGSREYFDYLTNGRGHQMTHAQ